MTSRREKPGVAIRPGQECNGCGNWLRWLELRNPAISVQPLRLSLIRVEVRSIRRASRRRLCRARIRPEHREKSQPMSVLGQEADFGGGWPRGPLLGLSGVRLHLFRITARKVLSGAADRGGARRKPGAPGLRTLRKPSASTVRSSRRRRRSGG